MEKLPPEVLFQIFVQLSQEDIKFISITCTQWDKIVQDFPLFEREMNLRSPLNYFCKTIVKDLKLYPTFGRSVEVVKVQEEREERRKNEDFYFDYGVDKFSSLIELCPNLEKLKISARGVNFLSSIATEILHREGRFRSNLTLLELDCNAIEENDHDYALEILCKKSIATNFAKLVNYTYPTLHKLVISWICDDSQCMRFAFVHDNLFSHNNCLIRALKIECPGSIMTKACLNYIISGQLENLEDLDLFLTLVDYIDENDMVVKVDEQNNLIIWKELKYFCSSNLKNYNIALKRDYYSYIFSFDNCKNKEDKFYSDSEDYGIYFDDSDDRDGVE